jgi:parallel beta-helix repeat protein
MDRSNNFKKIILVWIIVLFLGLTSFSIGTADAKKSLVYGNILYVGGSGPGNYTSIQDAINDSYDGDTVFVYSGIYYEHLQVDKDINLIGEDRESTFIDGSGIDTVVIIYASVTLRGFTIQNSGSLESDAGIRNYNPPPPDSDYIITISNNNIKNNKNGIYIGVTENHIIYKNNFEDNELGIRLICANDCEINNNNFISNGKHAYFEYYLFYQKSPKNNWNGNYWDEWHLQLPRLIKGYKEFVIVLRPGMLYKVPFVWFNFDWHPVKNPV